MHTLTAAGEQAVQQLAQRFGVSTDAVKTLLAAVSAGGGTMAQFYHSELGGGGQWMRGGMTMVGDMFNAGLQAMVNGLCLELSSLLASTQVFAPAPPSSTFGGFSSGNGWWPSELGSPSASGGQNDARYAYFPGARRLALSRQGQITIYDTLDHQIGGVQQQQGGYPGSLSFSSQYGTFNVDSLPQVSPAPMPNHSSNSNAAWSSVPSAVGDPAASPSPTLGSDARSSEQIIQAIERLGQLAQAGVLTEEEFKAKKAELLARL